MCGSSKFFRRGSISDNVFLLSDEGREDPNSAKSRPSCGALQRNTIIMPAKRQFNGNSPAGRLWSNIERWLSSFVIFIGTRTSIAQKPHIFVIYQGRGVRALYPSLDLYTQKLIHFVAIPCCGKNIF